MITDIATGKYDDQMDALMDAVNRRRKLIAQQAKNLNMATIDVGNTVRLTGLRPKYLNGVTTEVLGKNQSTLSIRIPFEQVPYNSKYAGQRTTVPANCVEVV